MPEKPTKVRKKSSRKTRLSREEVLRVALRLADSDGIASLSMRKLAEALRVEPMSLYNHVKNKEDLLDGLVDLVAAEIELPKIGSDWRTELRRRALSAHEVLMRHRWASQLFVSRMNIGPAMLRYVDATIGCLREAGFSWTLADHAWNAIDSYVYGFTLQALNFPLDPDEYAATAEHFLPLIPEHSHPYMRGMSLEVIAGRHDGLHQLEFGLDLLLDGLERLRATSPT